MLQEVAEFGNTITDSELAFVSSCNFSFLSLKCEMENFSHCVSWLKEVILFKRHVFWTLRVTQCRSTYLIVCACATVCVLKPQIQNVSFKFMWLCYVCTTFAEKKKFFLLICLFLLITEEYFKFKQILFHDNIRAGFLNWAIWGLHEISKIKLQQNLLVLWYYFSF